MVKSNQIFDRSLLKHNLNRFSKHFTESDFLFKEIANRTIDNIKDFKQNFPNILEIGARDGYLGRKLAGFKESQNFIQTNFYELDKHPHQVRMDDEISCFKENSFDLIINNLNFQFVNDIPRVLVEGKNLLRKDGIFINIFFGGTTLKELRNIINRVDLEINGGIGPRIIPFIDVKDAGALASKAGFKNVISDSQIIEISYSSILKLLQDLKNMSLSNILHDRNKRPITKKMLFLMEKLIKDLYPDGEDGFIVSFEVITITTFN